MSEDVMATIERFEQIEAWQEARRLTDAIYALMSEGKFSRDFGLRDQIRRAAVSLTNNIAEGHGRYHYLDQIRFILQSRGSLEELVDDLNVCEDEQYLADIQIIALKEQGWRVRQLLDGYIRYLRQQTASPRSRVKDEEWSSEDADDSQFSM